MASLDACEGWQGAGIVSFAQWASINLGISARAAERMLATAKALRDLPVIAAALAEGRLSYDKARAIARVATPERQDEWVELASQASATQLERICAAYRRLSEDLPPDDDADRHERRSVTFDILDCGLERLVAILEPEEMALVKVALEVHVETDWRDRPAEGRQPEQLAPIRERRADALVAAADVALVAGPQPGTGGERPTVVVHADADVLAGLAQVGRSYLEGGPSLSFETARRFACDCKLQTMIEKGRDPLNLGRSRRLINRRQRRALLARDRGCIFPGCGRTVGVDGHHIVHWPDGGPTDLTNLCLLCKRHHRPHHEGGYRMRRERGGRLRFFRPDGTEIGPPPAPAITISDSFRHDPGLPRAESGGGRYDHQLTMSILRQPDEPDGRDSAG